MTFQLKGLREQRESIKAQVKALGDVMRKESRALNAGEQETFGKLQKEFERLNVEIRTGESSLAAVEKIAGDAGDDLDALASGVKVGREDRSGDPRPKPRGNDGAELANGKRDRALAFGAWARAQHGLKPTAEQRAACKRTGINPKSREWKARIGGPGSLLKRTMGIGTAALGGNTVAPDFSYALEKAMVDFSNVRGVCDQFTTDTSVNLNYPTEDDTASEGAELSENTETDFSDDSFGVVTFSGYKYSSKGILISYELLNDSAFDLETHIGELIGMRLGRIQGRRFTTGTGSSQPQGIVTAASLGQTTAGAAAITAPELTRLAFSVDRAYRSDPSCGYMMHDSVMAYVLLLADTQGRPLIRDSYRDGIMLPTLNGFPVYCNQYMEPTVSNVPVTAKKHVLFGAFSKHKIRDIGTVRVRRLDERYAEKDQVGFIGFARADSRCVNTNAIKYLLQA